MQIEFERQLIKLAVNGTIVLINAGTERAVSKESVNELILLGDIENAGGYAIVEPGEYELYGVHVTALETKSEKIGVADLFQIDGENITVTYQQNPETEIDKSDWENLDDSDVLLVNFANVAKGLGKVINRHNPYKLVGFNADADTAAKLAELPVKESVSKLKFQDKEFSAEEYATEHFLLTN